LSIFQKKSPTKSGVNFAHQMRSLLSLHLRLMAWWSVPHSFIKSDVEHPDYTVDFGITPNPDHF